MARIPVYQSVTRPAQGATIDLPRASPEAFGAGIGESLERLGGTMQREAARKRREAEEAADNAAMTDAAKQVELARADVQKQVQTARDGAAADGAGHVDGLLAFADQRTGKVLDGITNSRARAWAERQFIALRGDVDVRESGWAAAMRAGKVAGDYGEARDLRANSLFTMPDRADLDRAVTEHDEIVDGLALPADVKAKLKTENRHQFSESYARGLAERDPYALRKQIDDGNLNGLLAPDALATMRNRADSEIRGREAAARAEAAQRRAEAAAAEREAKAAAREHAASVKDMARDMADGLRAGVAYSPAEIAAVAGAAARLPGGQALARNVALLGEANATSTALRGAPPRAVQDEINALSAALAKGGRDAPVLKARLDAALAVQSAQKSGLAADPLSYATSQGVVRLQPLDIADGGSVRARLVHARKVQARYGGPLAVLTDEEAAEYQSRLWSGDANQRMAALKELRTLGGEGAAAAMRQIGKGRPVEARAGQLLATPAGAATSNTILKGMDVIKANPKAVPDAARARELAPRVLGNALRYLPDIRNAVPDAARAYLAGIGGSEHDEAGLQAAMGRAAAGGWGGADGRSRGGIGERRGAKVLLPDSKTEDEFNGAMDRLTAAGLPPAQRPVWADKSPVDDAALRRAYPFAVGDGRYVLATDPDGTRLIMRADGTRFVVTVR